jgi:hypothetical protein
VQRRFVSLHGAAALAGMILELARRRIEGVAHRDVNVLMRVIFRRFAVDHELAAARHFHVDAHMVELAFVAAAVGGLDHHAATHDPVGEAVQLGGLLAHLGLDRRRCVHIPEADLQGELHGVSSRF